MQHPWERYPAIKNRLVPLPRYLPALAATSQNCPPHSPQMMHENSQPIEVARNSMVLVIAQGDLSEPIADQRCRLMLSADQLCLDRMQLRHHPLLGRLAPDDKGPVAPSFPAVVRETQEREGFRLSLPPLFPVPSGVPPELNQPRLVRV